mgnify:CR=1 FL=1
MDSCTSDVEPLAPEFVEESVAVAQPSSTPNRSKRPRASKDEKEGDHSGSDDEEEDLESAGASKKKHASPVKSTKKSPAKKGKNARGRK